MKRTQYIKYKTYGEIFAELHTNNNKNLLIFIQGLTLPACMFFDLPIYEDGSSIKDEILKNGYDVLFIDPVGYGSSRGIVFPLYTRIHVAEQIEQVIRIYKNGYSKIFLEGFCGTCNIPLLVAEKIKIDGIILIGPIIVGMKNSILATKKYLQEKKDNHSIDFQYLKVDFEEFIVKKLIESSDILIKDDPRVPDWEKKFLKRLSQIENFKALGEKKWYGSRDMANDMYMFKAINHNEGWNPLKITCPFVMMRGEFDLECSEKIIDEFIDRVGKNRCIKKVIPGSTHYGMWGTNFKFWTNSLIEGLNQMEKL